MKIIRIVLLALIVLVAGFVTVAALGATTTTVAITGSSENYSSMTAAALSDYDVNASNTDNVYQQQVVAAWGAKDLLTVIAKQNSVMIDNQDTLLKAQAAQVDNANNLFALLKAVVLVGALIVAAVAVVGATLLDRKAPAAGSPGPATEPSVPSEPHPSAS
jgi:hypothetical protein